MKKSLFFSLVCILMAMMAFPSYGQAPQSFKYQSIARNSSGLPIANDNIGLRIGIHDGSATGTLVYQETHLATTNAFGLFTISVGAGTTVSGTFSGIDWGAGEKFIEVEADFNGGTAYTSMGASQLLSVPYALYSSNGTPGPTGPQGPVGLTGPQGPQGSAGNDGADGTDGIDGLNVLNGVVDPSGGVGVDGEIYINTVSNTLFGPKAGGVWPVGISLVGPQGAAGTTGATGPQGAPGNDGANGIDGANGLNVLNGTSDPTGGTGVDGEFYINTVSNALFGPKSGGAWPVGISLIGPTGATGATGLQGAAGNDGTAGINGLNVLSGSVDPVGGTGVNGEFYINTATNTLFGPKASGTWPAGVLLVGPQGIQGIAGPQGVQGPQGIQGIAGPIGTNGLNVLNGTTDPTAGVGVNGEFYINTSLQRIFGPKAGGVWPAGVTLYGPAGPIGQQGFSIRNGAVNPTPGDGANGDFYINTATNFLFGPKAGGAWPAGISLVGPAGPTGLLTPGAIAGNTPYWDGTNWITNSSNIFNNGGNVGIGTSTPGAKLDIGGTVKIADGTQGAGKVLTSDASGLASWTAPSSGGWGLIGNAGTVDGTNFIGTTDNVALNFRVNNQKAGRIDPAGSLFIGASAGNVNTSPLNTGIGFRALSLNIGGSENTAIGFDAMRNNTSGYQNSALGYGALNSNIAGAINSGFGYFALYSNTGGGNNTAMGAQALQLNTNGSFNTAHGKNALRFTTGSNNTGIGFESLYANTSGSNNTAIGFTANVGSGGLTNATAIGNGAIVNSSNAIQLGNNAVTQVFAGTGSNATLITGGLQITGGTPATGKVLTSDATGLATWQAAGGGSGWGLTGNAGTNQFSDFIGTTDNQSLTVKVNSERAGWLDHINNNTSWGYQAANTSSGLDNTAIGAIALFSNSSGLGNTAIGSAALYSNTTGNYNSAVGNGVLPANTTGQQNIAMGGNALQSNTIGNYNTGIGRFALTSNVSGSNNTAIGYQANVSSGSLSNSTAIGNGAIVNASNTIQLGNNAVTEVRMGTGNTATVITGGLRVTGGSPAVGKVLTSDATGLATWQDPAGGGGAIGYGQKVWSSTFSISSPNVWVTIPGSDLNITTNGGALVITTNLFLSGTNGNHATCQSIIDGVWAGTYSSMFDPSSNGIFWKEGILNTYPGWVSWSTTRIYPGVPPGNHTIALQCAINIGSVTVGTTSTNNSHSYIELN